MDGLILVPVRVYLTNELETKGKPSFKVEVVPSRNGDDVRYSFNGLRIGRNFAQFYVDTLDGVIPEALKPFAGGYYSICKNKINGYRHEGFYRDERFDKASAEISHYGERGNRIMSFNIKVIGSDLQQAIDLYNAILADELVPIDLGGQPATQLLDELKTAQDELKTARAELDNRQELMAKYIEETDALQLQILNVNARLVGKETPREKQLLAEVNTRRELMTQLEEALDALLIEVGSLKAEIVQKNIDIRDITARNNAEITNLRSQLAKAKKRWYTKLCDWIMSSNGIMDF